MKARFIQHIGTRAILRTYWGDDCPNCGGTGRKGCHNAEKFLADSDKLHDYDLGGRPEDHPDHEWPTKCSDCGADVPTGATHQVFHSKLYNTDSGSPEPGDLFFRKYHKPGERCHHGWTNCDGNHLTAILPDGTEWDMDGRASNCTLPQENTHRCWCRHGEPPNITVDKNGNTCSAGAGSIASWTGRYHGFLQNGEFT